MVLSALVRTPWSTGAAHFNVVSPSPATGFHAWVAGGSDPIRASDRHERGTRHFLWRISGGSYGGSCLAARHFSPAPQNVTRGRTRRIREHVAPVCSPVVREKWPRALGDECPHREVEKNLAGSRHIVVRAQAEPPLEPEHGRQRGGDEQTVGEMPAHEWPHRAHREMRLQHPAVHRIGCARDDAQRIVPVPERRAFQSSAKIAAPDPTARRSFRIMITRGC